MARNPPAGLTHRISMPVRNPLPRENVTAYMAITRLWLKRRCRYQWDLSSELHPTVSSLVLCIHVDFESPRDAVLFRLARVREAR